MLVSLLNVARNRFLASGGSLDTDVRVTGDRINDDTQIFEMESFLLSNEPPRNGAMVTFRSQNNRGLLCSNGNSILSNGRNPGTPGIVFTVNKIGGSSGARINNGDTVTITTPSGTASSVVNSIAGLFGGSVNNAPTARYWSIEDGILHFRHVDNIGDAQRFRVCAIPWLTDFSLPAEAVLNFTSTGWTTPTFVTGTLSFLTDVPERGLPYTVTTNNTQLANVIGIPRARAGSRTATFTLEIGGLPTSCGKNVEIQISGSALAFGAGVSNKQAIHIQEGYINPFMNLNITPAVLPLGTSYPWTNPSDSSPNPLIAQGSITLNLTPRRLRSQRFNVRLIANLADGTQPSASMGAQQPVVSITPHYFELPIQGTQAFSISIYWPALSALPVGQTRNITITAVAERPGESVPTTQGLYKTFCLRITRV